VNWPGIGSAHKTFGKDGPFPLAEWIDITVNLTGTFNVTRLCAEQKWRRTLLRIRTAGAVW